jgi:hypothetical protein
MMHWRQSTSAPTRPRISCAGRGATVMARVSPERRREPGEGTRGLLGGLFPSGTHWIPLPP